ncbi:MAG: GAP family protein [Cyanobacteriota bacterium]|nr:GAP family protein [Cyanobacteriota bacterium]
MLSARWGELLGYALAIGFSPLHLALLLLLLLGPRPLWRGGFLLATWLLMNALVIGLLLGVGHGLVVSMEKGTSHRTALDLLAAGAFFALGLKALASDPSRAEGKAEWSQQLDRLLALPLPLLLLLSAGLMVVGPDDLFLYAKTAGALFHPGWDWLQDTALTLGFSGLTSVLLLLPLVACAVAGQERLRPVLSSMKAWLDRYGQGLVGGICIALALLVGWQGVEGLRLGGAMAMVG